MKAEINNRLTLQEVIEKYSSDLNVLNCEVVYKEDALSLLQFVREKTIQECLSKAKVDFNIRNAKKDTEIEVFLLEESLLELDKNSIEL